MIKSIGGQGGAAIDAAQLRASGKARAADLLSSGQMPDASGVTPTPAARMAALGAPTAWRWRASPRARAPLTGAEPAADRLPDQVRDDVNGPGAGRKFISAIP